MRQHLFYAAKLPVKQQKECAAGSRGAIFLQVELRGMGDWFAACFQNIETAAHTAWVLRGRKVKTVIRASRGSMPAGAWRSHCDQ